MSTSIHSTVDEEAPSAGDNSTREKNVQRESLRIASVVIFYITVSVALVVLNKFLLSYSPIKFDFPLFITWFQLLFALGCVIVLGYLNKKGVTSSLSLVSSIPPFEFDITVGMDVLPMSIIYVAMLATNNLCLNYVEVSFFQIARSLSVCFQLFLTTVYLKQHTSRQALLGCVVVIAGFLVGSEGEVRFSWLGVFFGVLSSAFVAGNGVLIKRTLTYLNNDEWKSISYNTFLATLLMMPLLLFSGELAGVVDSMVVLQPPVVLDVADQVQPVVGGATTDSEAAKFSMSLFWLLMFLASLLGFLINVSVILLVKYTSPLTSVMVGTTKSCIQTVLSVLIFSNPISIVNGIGLALTIVGAFVYSTARFAEMKSNIGASDKKR